MQTKVIFIPLTFLFLNACTSYFIVSDFSEQTASHKKIAVLPFEIIFSGTVPENLSEEDIAQIEIAESQAFQISFHNELLKRSKSGKKNRSVAIQHYKETLQKLNQKGINIADSWKLSADSLAKVLNVDAVVQARIEKARYMSDLTSYGVEMGKRIISILSDQTLVPWFPLVSSRAKTIKTDYFVLDGKEGTNLWSVTLEEDADWRLPSNEIIDQFSRKAAKKFPYQE